MGGAVAGPAAVMGSQAAVTGDPDPAVDHDSAVAKILETDLIVAFSTIIVRGLSGEKAVENRIYPVPKANTSRLASSQPGLLLFPGANLLGPERALP